MTQRIMAALLIAGMALCARPVWADEEQDQNPTESAAEQQIATVLDTIVDALWLKTDEYWHEANTEPVIGICRMIVQLDPKFVEAYNTGAWIASMNGQDDVALQFYRQGIERNPDSYELLIALGYSFYWLHKGDVKAGLPHLKRAAELPSPAHVKRVYARGLAKAGKTQEAIEQWRKVLKEFPDDRFAPKELQKLLDAQKGE